MTELLDQALEYAQRGSRVLPLHTATDGVCSCSHAERCSSPAKHPRTFHGVDDATSRLEAVRNWWTRWPDSNIGLGTGDGRVVIDVDPRHGGHDALADLERVAAIPPCPTVATGGGGTHYWLKAPPETPGATLAPGLDLKARGGFVVAPPSVHVTGRLYVWTDRGLVLPPAPGWALHRGRAQQATPVSEWRRIARDGVTEGARNTTAARLVGHLLRRHVDPIVALELLRSWNAARNRPPLADDELDQVVDRIADREARRLQERST